MTLIEQEQEKRRREGNGAPRPQKKPASSLIVRTPVEAQAPTVLTSAQEFRKETPASTPSRTPAPQVVPSSTRGPAVQPFDPTSGRERPQELGFWRGWIRDRVRNNLTDENKDGRYEVPFWLGAVNSGVNLVTPGNDRTNQEIADNKRNRDRDEQARAIARGSDVQDQVPMTDDRLYNPDEIKARVDQINRGREVGDAEDVQTQELDVIDRSNAPTLEQIASGERQNRDTNQTTLTIGRENNQSAEDMNSSNNTSAESMNSSNNDTTRRGQDNDRDISILGMDNDLDLAEIQRLANQDTIASQNQLAQQQYAMQLEMYEMDREERKSDKRQDSLSALLAGLATLGATMSL